MKRQKLKFLLPVAVFLLSGSFSLWAAMELQASYYENYVDKAQLNAESYAERLVGDFNKGFAITETLEKIIISEDGSVRKFDVVAEEMMDDFVQSIQIAPNGVVTEIYPAEGNADGKIDLVNDEKRGPVVRYGIENNVTVMQGPFDLNQGGVGIAIRNPVFLDDENGEPQFWGLTVAIIRVPEIFIDSFNALSDFGYFCRLSKTSSLSNTDFKEVYCSGDGFENPVVHNFELGGCEWKLEIMPADGWNNGKYDVQILISCAVIVLLLTGMAAELVVLDNSRKKLKVISTTDPLTGLDNRNGFDEKFGRYVKEHNGEPCVGIMLDIDNFKFINDVYGHSIGDEALQNLAETMRKAFGGKNVIMGRNGGDEFCIILKNCTNENAKELISNFVKAKRTFKYNGETHNYTISAGYADYPSNTKNPAKLLHCADMALYEVKLNGKQSCLPYTHDFRVEKRAKLGFGLNDVSENLPGAFLIYKADKNDDQLLFANKEMIQLAGCKDFDDFMAFTKGKFSSLIHPDERKTVEESIWKQIMSTGSDANDYVKFNFATKSGEYRPVIDYGRIVDNAHYGKVFYVLVMDWDFIDNRYNNCDNE